MKTWTLSTRIRFGAYFMMFFGVLMSLSLLPPMNGVLMQAVDLVFWPLDGQQQPHRDAPRLMTAVIGGITMGWSVTLLILSGEPAHLAPRSVRKAALMGYLSWFLLDGLGSIIAGAPWNLLGNALFLAFLVVPLLQTSHQRSDA
ncbi:hypothetical protein [Aliiroseovarius sp.]|uniref:hypothetical protein n=1 Tax=Aliiroseovarius sp. TaxID=1872442 RepID=UPI003BA9A9E6